MPRASCGRGAWHGEGGMGQGVGEDARVVPTLVGGGSGLGTQHTYM